MPIRAIAMCIGLLAALPASAQTAAPVQDVPPAESEDSRYSFNRVDDGYLRLDVHTGQVSLCSRRQVGWACQAVPDERVVLEKEIARLQSENGALKRELLSRGLALPAGISPLHSAAKTETAPKSRNSNVDQVMTLVEVMWRRLVEMIASLQRDMMKKG